MGIRSSFGKLPTIVLLAMMLSFSMCRPGLANEKDAGQLLLDALQQFESLHSYTCRLDKRVAKDGTLHEDLSIFVKYKKPAHYYFRWEKGDRAGREVIFVADENDGKIVAHPGGWFRFMTFRLNPDGRLAMKENRHSLRSSGLEKIMHVIEADYHRSRLSGPDAIRFVGEERFGGRHVWIICGQFPADQGYYAKKVVMSLDQTLRLPVKVSIYDWSDVLVEEYVFHQLKINVGFSDRDFDPGNPDYGFFGG